MACDLVEVARQLLLSQVFRGPYRSRPGGRRDWRVLVTDSRTREVLQSLLTVDQVLAENIVRIDNIEDTERLPVDSSAIYLLSSRRGQEEVMLGLRRHFVPSLRAADTSIPGRCSQHGSWPQASALPSRALH